MSIQDKQAQAMYGFSYIEQGGVTSAQGFRAAGIHAGFRRNAQRLDFALVEADEACPTAAVFTQNVFCAAPVQFSKAQLEASSGHAGYGCVRAIFVNSGNANAATGVQGFETARAEAQLAADEIGCPVDEVLVASTGVIGVQLPHAPFETGIPTLRAALSKDGGSDAACAIMTTDTLPKECAVAFEVEGVTYAVGGMSKGSGMIMPNMATMIAVLTTDAPVAACDLHAALREAVGVSFNKIKVDSDTSTNDSCFLMASGAAAQAGQTTATFQQGTEGFSTFVRALKQVCTALARFMAQDGEGATKLVTVQVSGAANAQDADAVARTIANSPLVKTAIAGRDANWGRIAAAAGRAGAAFSQEHVDISIMGIDVCKQGLSLVFDEDEALRRFEEPEIVIAIALGAGDASTTMWTCDLTHDYISINGDYRT